MYLADTGEFTQNLGDVSHRGDLGQYHIALGQQCLAPLDSYLIQDSTLHLIALISFSYMQKIMVNSFFSFILL